MRPSKSPQQMRAELPDYMRVTTGHDSELAPLILKENDAMPVDEGGRNED